MRPARLLPTLAALTVVLLWGMSFVASKAVLNTGFPPLSMALARFAVASLVLAPLRRVLEPGRRFAGRGERLLLAASGLLGVTVYFFFETRGIRLTSASNAALIIATIPVFTVAAERLFFGSPIRWTQGLGIALSVAGVYLIVGRGGAETPRRLEGDLFMLGACLSWVAYVIVSRRLHTGASRSLSLAAWQNLIGAGFLLPLALTERSGWFLAPPAAWLNILYLALFCSALGYFLYQYALASIGAVAVAAWVNLIPVVGAAGGVVLLRETLAPTQIAGGLVVVGGVFLANRGDGDRWARRGPSRSAPARSASAEEPGDQRDRSGRDEAHPRDA